MSAHGCSDLWREVLFLTIQDALHGVRMGGLTRPMRLFETKAARDYLTKPNRDFDIVCTFAGIDPVAARESFTAMISNAPSPEELMAIRSSQRKQPRTVHHAGRRRRRRCSE